MAIIHQPKKSFKQFLRSFVEDTPILSDYYYHYWLFPRNPNLYRGVFCSFSEALSAVPQGSRTGYNYRDIYDSRLKDLLSVRQFKAMDYPILVWLKQAFANSSTVFDLGGTTGYGYYAYHKYITYPQTLDWLVCEVPEIVKVGEELLTKIDSPGLRYTTDILDAKGTDIFLSCGALQYFEESLSEMLDRLPIKPRHLIINHVPFHGGNQYVTLQRLFMIRPEEDFVSYIPFKVQNRTQFINDLAKLGYRLIDSWQQERKCLIPFHPECSVDAFHGFYFVHQSSAAS